MEDNTRLPASEATPLGLPAPRSLSATSVVTPVARAADGRVAPELEARAAAIPRRAPWDGWIDRRSG